MYILYTVQCTSNKGYYSERNVRKSELSIIYIYIYHIHLNSYTKETCVIFPKKLTELY